MSDRLRQRASTPASRGLTAVVSGVMAAVPVVLLPELSFHFDVAPKIVLLLLGHGGRDPAMARLRRGSDQSAARPHDPVVSVAAGCVRRLADCLDRSLIAAGAFVRRDELAAAGIGVPCGSAELRGGLSRMGLGRHRARPHSLARHHRRGPPGLLLRHRTVLRHRPAVAHRGVPRRRGGLGHRASARDARARGLFRHLPVVRGVHGRGAGSSGGIGAVAALSRDHGLGLRQSLPC